MIIYSVHYRIFPRKQEWNDENSYKLWNKYFKHYHPELRTKKDFDTLKANMLEFTVIDWHQAHENKNMR